MITVRNDDVSVSTDLAHLRRFCEICDRHGARIIQAVTPVGDLRPLYNDASGQWCNLKIGVQTVAQSNWACVMQNDEMWGYLSMHRDRDCDEIALHGWQHINYKCENHKRFLQDWELGKRFLEWLFDRPVTRFVAPFNGVTPEMLSTPGVEVLHSDGPHLENIILGREPIPEKPDGLIYRCHSWRFGERFSYEQLGEVLSKIAR